jgi:hypothetical protein
MKDMMSINLRARMCIMSYRCHSLFEQSQTGCILYFVLDFVATSLKKKSFRSNELFFKASNAHLKTPLRGMNLLN